MPRNRPGRIKPHDARRNWVRRRSIAAIYQKLVVEFDLDGFLSRTASLLLNTLPGVDAVAVFLYDDDFKKQLVPVSESGCGKDNMHEIYLAERSSLTGKVFNTRKPFLLTRQRAAKVIAEIFHSDPLKRGTFSLLCIPMENNTRIGYIMFLREHPKNFSPKNLIFLKKVGKLLGTFIYKERTLRQTQEKNFSNLVCTLSHELRTPLTCIKGYATTLLSEQERWSSEERCEFLKIIDSETNTMNKLIGELMETSMIESGLLSITKEPVLLEKVVKKAVNDAQLNTKKHRFILSVPRNLPIIEADSDRIRQVLDNLLDNAIKYSPKGGLVVIQCHVEKKEVKISVADEGIGIAPEHLNRLFEKFYRVKSDLAGTGLGLPVACEIVEKHGGRIWAKSTPEKGSTFFFTLPLTEVSNLTADE